MSDPFYLTLNSDASGEFFSYNTNSNFKTHLGKMITLENSWEVAITELRVPMTLANVSPEMCNIIGLSNETDEQIFTNFSIKSGHYKNNFTFLTELNTVFAKCLAFNIDVDGYINIDTLKDLNIYNFSAPLKEILGIHKDDVIGHEFIHKGVIPFNIQRGLSSTLNVNVDIIDHQLIDNTHNTCLRSVPTYAADYNFGFDKHYSFQRLHYKKIKCNRLEYISINITDNKNRSLSFLTGNSTVQLHFRRCLE